MEVTILNQNCEVVEIINESQVFAVMAAQAAVLEATLSGKKYTAIDEDGESVLSADFVAITPAANPDVKFEGYNRDQHGETLATFSGVFVF